MLYSVKSELQLKRYNKFIDCLRQQNIIGYFEEHHIVPRSMGGTNDKSNLIKLTARQHFIAHWLLWKAYGSKMTNAFHIMLHGKGKRKSQQRYNKINSKTYEILMKECAEQTSKRSIGNTYALGNKLSDEAKEKLRKARALQIIPKEVYEKRKLKMINRIWMNDSIRSYRIHMSEVENYKQNGFVEGRLINYATKQYREKIKNSTNKMWKKQKELGYPGRLTRIKNCHT